MDYSIQLFSVTGAVDKDIKGTLKALADMGYTYIEPCHFSGLTATEYKAMCDELGLKIGGVHLGAERLENDETIEDTIKYLKEVGCPLYIIPWVKNNTTETRNALIGLINAAKPKFDEAGIEFAYHNHVEELKACVEDGRFTEIELINQTNTNFEVDVYWASRAKINPLFLLELVKDRLVAVHMKDGANGKGTPLGGGETPLKDIHDWAVKQGKPMVVECEPHGLSIEEQLENAKISIDYLKSL